MNHRRIIGWAIASVALFLAASLAFVSLIYIPRQVVYAARYPVSQTPSDVGVAFENISLSPADESINLAGWWMPAQEPIATLVFLHGGSSNRHSSYFECLNFYKSMVERNVSVFAIDLRNHGESDTAPGGIQFGLSEKEDGLAAIEWARRREPELPLYAMGISMGGATLIHALTNDPPPLHGVILLDPLLDTRTCFIRAVHAETGIPDWALIPSAWSAETFFGLPGEGQRALDMGKNLELRTLLIQDPGDPVTLPVYARQLSAAHPHIRLWMAPKVDPQHPDLEWKGRWGSHVSAFALFPELTLAEIMQFIQDSY